MPKFIAENGETLEINNENVFNLLERNGFKLLEEVQEDEKVATKQKK